MSNIDFVQIANYYEIDDKVHQNITQVLEKGICNGKKRTLWVQQLSFVDVFCKTDLGSYNKATKTAVDIDMFVCRTELVSVHF